MARVVLVLSVRAALQVVAAQWKPIAFSLAQCDQQAALVVKVAVIVVAGAVVVLAVVVAWE